MPDPWISRRSSRAVTQFEVWFGGIFLGVGLVAALVGSVLFVVLRSDSNARPETWIAVIVPLGIGTIFALMGGFFVRRGLRKVRREQRLRAFGTTTEATVTAVEPTNTTLNGRRLWHVRYAYSDLYGVTQMAESGYLSAEEAQSYRAGENVFVRYDPEQPSESIWLGRDQLPGP